MKDLGMITREPTIERLAIARSLLLEPYGLTDATLSKALQTIATHRIDDADLYFQYTRSEGWSAMFSMAGGSPSSIVAATAKHRRKR